MNEMLELLKKELEVIKKKAKFYKLLTEEFLYSEKLNNYRND